MFANILDKFSPAAAFAVKLFAAAKLDFHQAFASGDENALKVAIEKFVGEKSAPSVDVAAAVEAATSELQKQLKAEQDKSAAVAAQAGALNSALAAFGAKVVAADAAKGITQADVEKALADRSSILAQEQLAKLGLPAPLATTPAADPTKAAAPKLDPQLKGFARVQAAFKAASEKN